MRTSIISLTFDDGFMIQYDVAKYLYKLDIQSSFYLITGLRSYEGKPLLIRKPELIKEMHDMGHEIGSHTHTHRNLVLLSDVEVEYECLSSIKVLEEIIKEKPMGLAYPFGVYNERVLGIVRKYFAYARAMGKRNRWNEELNPFKIGGIGLRHILKLALKILARRELKLAVLVFHCEPPWLIKQIAQVLKDLGFDIIPLYEAVKKIGMAKL